MSNVNLLSQYLDSEAIIFIRPLIIQISHWQCRRLAVIKLSFSSLTADCQRHTPKSWHLRPTALSTTTVWCFNYSYLMRQQQYDWLTPQKQFRSPEEDETTRNNNNNNNNNSQTRFLSIFCPSSSSSSFRLICKRCFWRDSIMSLERQQRPAH